MNNQKFNQALMFRIVAIGFVLYLLFQNVTGYLKGGPDAPSLTLLLVSIVVLGGGAVLIGWLTWKSWKAEKALAELQAEEAEETEDDCTE